MITAIDTKCSKGHDLSLPGARVTLPGGYTYCRACRAISKNQHPVDPIDLVQQDSLSLAALYRKGKAAGVITHRSEYGG